MVHPNYLENSWVTMFYIGVDHFIPNIKAQVVIIQSNPALQTPSYYGCLIIIDSLLCPWGKKALTFSLDSTHLIQTPH